VFGQGAPVKFFHGAGDTDNNYTAALIGEYGTWSPTNGLGGGVAIYTKNSGSESKPSKKAEFTFTGNLSFNSGLGIDFSATSGTGTSELFDDYEEGVWTPTLFGAGTTGSYTFTTQSGRYTKVGDVVYVTAQLTVNAVNTALSGNVRFGGWPYSSGTNTGLRLTVTSSGVNWDSSTYDHYYGYFAGGTTMQLFGVRDNGAQGNLGSGAFTVSAGDTVTITGFYFV
jgi:hypothetical protein